MYEFLFLEVKPKNSFSIAIILKLLSDYTCKNTKIVLTHSKLSSWYLPAIKHYSILEQYLDKTGSSCINSFVMKRMKVTGTFSGLNLYGTGFDEVLNFSCFRYSY